MGELKEPIHALQAKQDFYTHPTPVAAPESKESTPTMYKTVSRLIDQKDLMVWKTGVLGNKETWEILLLPRPQALPSGKS